MRGLRPLLPVLALLAPTLAGAQVGHDPRTSPYRDLKHGSMLVPEVGFFQGGGGTIGVAPNSGTLYGFRAEIGAKGPLLLGFEFATGTLERLIVDADDPVATRVKGPVDQRYTLLGLNLKLNLTGGKTWHGLAPYIGGGGGLSTAAKVAADTSGWNYGNRLYFAPTAGVRVFLTPGLYLRGEVRAIFARVTYPQSYRDEPAFDPGDATASNAVLAGKPLREWVASGVYTVGIGFPFPWP